MCGISFFMTVSPRPRILSNVDVDDVAASDRLLGGSLAEAIPATLILELDVVGAALRCWLLEDRRIIPFEGGKILVSILELGTCRPTRHVPLEEVIGARQCAGIVRRQVIWTLATRS